MDAALIATDATTAIVMAIVDITATTVAALPIIQVTQRLAIVAAVPRHMSGGVTIVTKLTMSTATHSNHTKVAANVAIRRLIDHRS